MEGLKQEANKQGDQALFHQFILKTDSRYSDIIKYLTTLAPPDELADAHKKFIEIFKYEQMMYKAIQEEDRNSMYAYQRRVFIFNIDYTQELKRVFSEHGAPKEVIDNTDRQIMHLRQLLNKLPIKNESKPLK